MPLSPGDRLDRYEVIALLGSGGMGEVYRARDPKLARDVALKVLRIDAGLGTEGAPRLLREARAVAALSHANVLAVYDVGEVQEPEALKGVAYIAMELVVGQPLRAFLGDGSIPIERRVGWLRDVALALGAAHAVGIVHRDVKAENVMIRSDGAVKVLDFGIARRVAAQIEAWSSMQGQSLPTADTAQATPELQTLTGEGTVVGTPFYMAPEQLRGEELDARADQFGWGVVAYWLLTGQPPWQGAQAVALLSQILSTNPVPPAEKSPLVPARVSEVIMRALEKRREDRFPSMRALIDALGGAPADVAPTSMREPQQGDTARSPSAQTGFLRTDASAAANVPPATVRPLPRARANLAWVVAAVVLSAGAVLVWRGQRPPASNVQTTSSAAVTSPAAAEECASNADCVHAHAGGAWHCHRRRHVCVEVASADCKAYSEPHDPEANDVVWIGGMFPLSTDPLLVSEMRATELARRDFAQSLGSGAAGSGALHARPIALAICDEGVDPMRAARHLADDLEVPAVIGFRSAANARETIAKVFLPSHTLSFLTISQEASLTHLPEPPDEPRLIWRATVNSVNRAAPLAELIAEVVEPAARAGAHGIGDRPLRVAAVWSKKANHDTVEALFSALRFNGRSALDNGTNFRQLVYEAGEDAGAGEVVDALLTFGPQVVVFTDRAFYAKVLAPLEAAWSTGPGGEKRASGPRPVYLTTSGLSAPAFDFVGRDASRRHRFFAVANRSTTMTNAQLMLRYNIAFPADPVIRTEVPQPSYDAFYTLAYAAYSLGDAPITGPALSRAIERLLPPGLPIDVGPAQIVDGFQALRSGRSIDLNGAIGTLDFDPKTGEAPIDYSVICINVDDHGKAADTVESDLYYDARTKKLVGELRCP